MTQKLTSSPAFAETRAYVAAASASFTMNKSGLLTPSVPKRVVFIADCKQLLMMAFARALQQTGTAKVNSTRAFVRNYLRVLDLVIPVDLLS
jgi:hypothetical protein